MQSRSGLAAASVRIVSNQHPSPPPRSLAHCHQPLYGVMTTKGASVGSRPAIFAVTL